MAFRLRAGQPIGRELKRVYESQLDAAIEHLRTEEPCDMHAVRKHVKKARALLFASREAQADYRDADDELKIANRSLGVLSDAHRIIEATRLLRGFDRARLPDAVLQSMRLALTARAATFDAIANRDDTRGRAARLLISARKRASNWDLDALDAEALAGAIREAHDLARAPRRQVRRRPTVKNYHRWRRRVKLEWYLFRIIEEHTGDRLRDDRHRLAALDACLGELHDLNVLAAVIGAEPMLSRHDSAGALVALRAFGRDLRRRTAPLAVVLSDRSADVGRRVETLWGMPPTPLTEAAWPASA